MDDNGDAYSLHTLGDEEHDALLQPSFEQPHPTYTADRSHADDNNDDSDDDIPAAFFESKVVLDCPPVFSWTRTYCWLGNSFHQYMTWKYGPLHIMACFWAALVGSQMLAMGFAANPNPDPTMLHYQWGPAIMVTVLLSVTGYVVSGHIHHMMQQPCDSRFYSGNYPNQLWWSFASIAVLAAPVLTISIFDYYSIVQERSLGAIEQQVRLNSWTQLLPNLHGNLPALTHRRENKEAWDQEDIASADMWMPSNGSLRAAVYPDHMSFTLPHSGRGPGESSWYGSESSQVSGAYMPVQPVFDPSMDSLVLSTSWEVYTNVLKLGLECDYISIQESPRRKTVDGLPRLSIHATDLHDCSASIELPSSRPDEKAIKSLHRLLSILERDAYGGDGGQSPHQAALDRIESYRKLFFDEDNLVSYQPVWVVPSKYAEERAAGTQCDSRLLIVGVGPAFLAHDTVPTKSQIQVASCQAKFKTADIYLKLTKDDKSLYHERANFTLRQSQVTIDGISLAKDSDVARLQRLGSWAALSEPDTNKLNEAFVAHASSLSVENGKWNLAQVREEIYDAYWERLKPVGTLLMAGSFLGNAFVTEISTAAGLTLQEALSDRGTSNESPRLHNFTAQNVVERKVERVIFQTRTLFRFWLILVTILVTIQLWILQYECSEEYDDDYRAPWDISSIAARAALLRFSRAKDWLSSVRSYSSSLENPPTMLVGHWTVDESQGPSGLRVDIPKANPSRMSCIHLHCTNR